MTARWMMLLVFLSAPLLAQGHPGNRFVAYFPATCYQTIVVPAGDFESVSCLENGLNDYNRWLSVSAYVFSLNCSMTTVITAWGSATQNSL